jgi:L-iditol 2-dehydrogenase
MKQAVMTSPGRIEFRETPKPDAGPGMLLLRISRIGVCGSDIHVYHGKHPYTKYPVVQGHEVAGYVEECGEGVLGFARGDLVTIMPQVACGQCYPCRTGRYNICESLKVMGFQTTGAASEYFAVDEGKCLKLPAGMSPEEGAMIEPLAVAVHALSRAGSVAGKAVVVYGGGPIGNLVAQAARGLGAERVLITDTSDHRLGIAEACGIAHRVNPSREDLGGRMGETFGVDGADLAFECVGIEATMRQAVALARKGSLIVIVGVFGEAPRVDLGLVQDRELSLVGTLMYQEADYRKAIELAASEAVMLEPLMSAHFPFERYIDAYRFIEAYKDKSMKVFIDLG